jgi:hypothetical protein
LLTIAGCGIQIQPKRRQKGSNHSHVTADRNREKYLWKFPPVRLKGVAEVRSLGYRITATTSTLLGEYLTPQATADSISVIRFEGSFKSVFMVAWGFTPSFPNAPWCKVWVESQLERSKTSSPKSFIDAIRCGDGESRQLVEPPPTLRRNQDSVAISSLLRVTVKISNVNFLDRSAIEV